MSGAEHGASAFADRARGPADLSRCASQPIGADPSREPFKLLDLFSGIGGFSLGLERTGGFKTVAFCEIEEFPRRVLAKHWPEVPCYHDIRDLTAGRLADDGITVDAICGGFPCQDISIAWNGPGIAGARSGLWGEYARLIDELRPAYVLVENVAALLARGLGTVLGDLAALGYDAEWHCIPASHVGAHHRRDRLWIVAHPDARQRVGSEHSVRAGRDATSICGEALADALCIGRHEVEQPIRSRSHAKGAISPLIDPSFAGGRSRWEAEPDVGRVVDGIPGRVDRLKALGNAVVPQIPELIGNAILAAHLATPSELAA